MHCLSGAVTGDGDVTGANLRDLVNVDSSKERAVQFSAAGDKGPAESGLRHTPFHVAQSSVPIRHHAFHSADEATEFPEAHDEVPTKVEERQGFGEGGDSAQQALTADGRRSLLERKSASSSTTTEDDFDSLFKDDVPKKPKKGLDKGASSGETGSGKGNSGADSLSSLLSGTLNTGSNNKREQKSDARSKSNISSLTKAEKNRPMSKLKSMGTSSADFDFDLESSSNTRARDKGRSSPDSSIEDAFGSDSGGIFGSSNDFSNFGDSATSNGNLLASLGDAPDAHSDKPSRSPLDSTLTSMVNPFAQQPSMTPMTDQAEKWSKENLREFEHRMPNKMRDGPNPDSWYKNNISEKSVADLNRAREIRRTAEANQIATPIETVYTRAIKTVPAINYLGAGYDHVRGNPIGDPSSMGDPGLRPPVLRFSYAQNEDGVSNDLTVLQPIGGYVRPYVACKQSETVSELSTLNDYQNELSVDASLQGGDPIGLNSFSASAGYREFAKEVSKKDTKTYMLRTYCMRYEAGIAQGDQFKWNVTLAFAAAVEHLPDTFEGHNPHCGCSPEQWRQDEAADVCAGSNIPTWIRFIEQFGTHYLVRLFAGGKMTYQVTVKRSEVEKMKKKGADVKSQLKMQLVGVSGGGNQGVATTKNKSSSNYEMNVQKETLVIGGRPPANVSDPGALAVWADTVEELPMPVKFEVQPLHFLLPLEKQEAFKQAVAFYSKAVGLTSQDLSALTGVTRNLPTELTKATQVAWSGPPPGFAKCPEGQVVILGFAMHLNFKERGTDNFRISMCPPGREKCDGVGTASDVTDDGRIYILCGDEPINEIQQVVAETPIASGASVLEATCPDETVILGGFGISVQDGADGIDSFSVESCTTGQTVCTKTPSPGSVKNLLWMACIDKQYTGVRELINVATLGSHGKTNKHAPDQDGSVRVECPENTSIVLGYAMEMHTNMQLVRDKFIHCPEDGKACQLSGKGVDKGVLWVFDKHALFGWVICKTVNEPASHVATDVGKAKGTSKKKKGKKGKNEKHQHDGEEEQQPVADVPTEAPVTTDAAPLPEFNSTSTLQLADVKLSDL
uniref:MAC/Perforin domain-containing protein n=1 Tax=Neospora caninum (strain Liverpool) TaxID=572307 RepID=A0A0F7UB91_NEOCL|nr:TPA: MAC/Perforin domain-containing protein [Neospora caninum Liverpool]